MYLYTDIKEKNILESFTSRPSSLHSKPVVRFQYGDACTSTRPAFTIRHVLVIQSNSPHSKLHARLVLIYGNSKQSQERIKVTYLDIVMAKSGFEELPR